MGQERDGERALASMFGSAVDVDRLRASLQPLADQLVELNRNLTATLPRQETFDQIAGALAAANKITGPSSQLIRNFEPAMREVLALETFVAKQVRDLDRVAAPLRKLAAYQDSVLRQAAIGRLQTTSALLNTSTALGQAMSAIQRSSEVTSAFNRATVFDHSPGGLGIAHFPGTPERIVALEAALDEEPEIRAELDSLAPDVAHEARYPDETQLELSEFMAIGPALRAAGRAVRLTTTTAMIVGGGLTLAAGTYVLGVSDGPPALGELAVAVSIGWGTGKVVDVGLKRQMRKQDEE